MTRVKWKLISVHLEIVLTLIQDRCTVCGERTIGSGIILDTPDGTPGDTGHVASRYGPFGDGVQDSCTVCAKLTLGSEIVLDAPDATPR